LTVGVVTVLAQLSVNVSQWDFYEYLSSWQRNYLDNKQVYNIYLYNHLKSIYYFRNWKIPEGK